LVEKANKYFEARGPIENGVKTLSEAGIGTIAVAGNHDADVLPQLAERFKERGLAFELLGIGGRWQHVRVEADGESLSVLGWSFPQSEVFEDPLVSLPTSIGDGPVLGLVHGELGASASKYAPLSRERLRSARVDGWLLGHIHVPLLKRDPGAPWMLYPGSPQALDPGETGKHGVWIVHVASGALGEPQFVPLSTVRYERHRIDVSPCTDAPSLRRRIDDALTSLAEAAHSAGHPHVRDLVVDIELVGESPACIFVERVIDELSTDEIEAVVGVHVRSATNRVMLPLDLDDLSKGAGLACILARGICQLESGQSESKEAASLLSSIHGVATSLQPQARLQRGDETHAEPLDKAAIEREAALAARMLLGAIVGTTSGASRVRS
jgi:exonuclease SbcD